MFRHATLLRRWFRFERRSVWLGVPLAVASLIVGGCGGSGTTGSNTQAGTTAAASTPKQKVKAAVGDSVSAGGYAGDVKIKKVDFYGDFVGVTAETPEGGYNGAKCGDLDSGAKAIFQKIYDGTGWKGHATIDYEGGLVDSATGKALPTAKTGTFDMPPGQAKQINWSDEDQLSNIDWSIYRTFCHPALQ